MRLSSLAVCLGLGGLQGCLAVTTARVVPVTALMPPARQSEPREPEFAVSIERFIDERRNPAVFGYGGLSVSGQAPITADGDLSAAVEGYVAEALARKGVLRGASPLALRGRVQRAEVGALVTTRNYQADAAFELTILDPRSRARLWARGYAGSGRANDARTALAMAFGEALNALEADDSMLALRSAFLAAGGQVPAAPAAAAAPARRSDIDVVDSRAASRPDDYAFIAGIERYQSVPEAQFAERDAALFRQYAVKRLGVPEENVVSLLGAQATRGGLARYVEEWLPKNVSGRSRLWVYYSGHGAPDPVKGGAYLVPWDGDPAFLESSAYPVARLYERLAALKAKEIIVVLDACFSGAGGRSVLAQGARPLVTVRESAIPHDPRFSVLAAAAGDQITGALQDQGHGMFTYYLLKGLKGAARQDQDAHMTMSELAAYLEAEVPRAARRQNREQTPQVHAGDPALRLY
ncbi:MAG: caspase family protein [Elusimicrobia bacterium]|nr:caspase family protein [Elusimicrobiota bacterium]